MARDISKRLTQLRSRRMGTDRPQRLSLDAQIDLLAKSANLEESWQKRAQKPYTRYALGAMQEVGPVYTRVSMESAERVGKQLNTGLMAAGFSVEFRLQGSVPLNTHIRGASDVDLLSLDTGFFSYYPTGSRSQAGLYTNPSTRTSIGVLTALRNRAEKILEAAYPAAAVDTSGGKAIKISGGSLARPVDVVPSHWIDTVAYQASLQEHHRGVNILNKYVPEAVENLPFLHIKLINDRDWPTLGGLKKAIRLCKNVKSDAEEEGTSIPLSSFDIASIMYHANLQALASGATYDLAVLAETQWFLDWLYQNKTEAEKLVVPDGSRRIFDSADKYSGLRTLSVEMDDLLREVAKEQNFLLNLSEKPDLAQSRDAIAKSIIPAVQ
jgi:hypothetical protein